MVGKRVAFAKTFDEEGTWKLGGSMAEYAVTTVQWAIPLSDDLSLEEGASSIVNPMTAVGMVDRLKELNVKTVIITAAASQLGRMLINLCKKEGITPICTVRRPEQVGLLKTKHVINTSEDGWKKKMEKLCSDLKPMACLECIAGEMTGVMMEFLAFGGTLILYGSLSQEALNNIGVGNLMYRGLKIEGYVLTVNTLMKFTKPVEF